jgi:molybdopterin converting factor small subunit
MNVTVRFYSYFKDITGCEELVESIPAGATLGQLHEQVAARFPKLQAMRNSTLTAVGVDYQTRDHVLQDGDEVALFPPVQGG